MTDVYLRNNLLSINGWQVPVKEISHYDIEPDDVIAVVKGQKVSILTQNNLLGTQEKCDTAIHDPLKVPFKWEYRYFLVHRPVKLPTVPGTTIRYKAYRTNQPEVITLWGDGLWYGVDDDRNKKGVRPDEVLRDGAERGYEVAEWKKPDE